MIQVYTGNGKGKTTAALGLAVRAAMAGKRVFIGQFIKGMEYSELKLPKWIPEITIKQFGRDCFIRQKPTAKDIEMARKGLVFCTQILTEENHDIVILDEINVALFFDLFALEEVLELLESKAEHVELILTGRYAPREIIERADLVTEMVEVKHYYTKGVQARAGIEY